MIAFFKKMFHKSFKTPVVGEQWNIIDDHHWYSHRLVNITKVEEDLVIFDLIEDHHNGLIETRQLNLSTFIECYSYKKK